MRSSHTKLGGPELLSALVDRPIDDPLCDDLQRKSFINPILSMLRLSSESPSVVVGLEGKWGSGKTSCINLIKKQLEANGAIVIHYNPWLVSALDSLLSGFFVQFATSIGQRTRDTKMQNAAKQILKYGKLLTPIKLIPGVEPWGTMAESLLAPGMTAISQQNSFKDWDIFTQKSELEEAIKKLKKPIVVVVDDLDRLPPDEIRTVFQLIKAISDFQGVSYLVAYDVDIVASALGFEKPNVGRSYLEKIVQIPCPLPRLSMRTRKSLFRKAIFDELQSSECRNMEVDKKYVEEFLENTDAGMLISTPRELVRLRNRIRFQMHWAGNEVLFGDLVGFELLALQFPECFRHIIDHWESFMHTAIPETEALSNPIKIAKAVEHYQTQSSTNKTQSKSQLDSLLELCSPPPSPDCHRVLGALITFLFPGADGRLQYSSMRCNSPRRIDRAYTFLKVVQGSDYENSMQLSDCYDIIADSNLRSQILENWRAKDVAKERLGLTARLLDEADPREPADLASQIIKDSPLEEANAIELFMTKLLHTLKSAVQQQEVLGVLLEYGSRLDLSGRTIFNCLNSDQFTRANGLAGYPVGNLIGLGEPSSELRGILEECRSSWIVKTKSLLEDKAPSHAPPWIGVTLAIYSRWKPEELEVVKTFIRDNLTSSAFLDSLLFGAFAAHPSFRIPDYYPDDFSESLGAHHPDHELSRYLRSIGKLH